MAAKHVIPIEVRPSHFKPSICSTVLFIVGCNHIEPPAVSNLRQLAIFASQEQRASYPISKLASSMKALRTIGTTFSVFSLCLGVPSNDVQTTANLLNLYPQDLSLRSLVAAAFEVLNIKAASNVFHHSSKP